MASLLALLLTVLLVSNVAAGQFDRSKAVGPCIRGKCPEGHTCHRRECYPARMAMNDDPMEELFDDAKQQSYGSCLSNDCPYGFNCEEGRCVKPPAAIGPCINDLCPSGFKCQQSDYKCYKA